MVNFGLANILIICAISFCNGYEPIDMTCNAGPHFATKQCFRITRIGKFTCDLLSRCCWDYEKMECIQRGARTLHPFLPQTQSVKSPVKQATIVGNGVEHKEQMGPSAAETYSVLSTTIETSSTHQAPTETETYIVGSAEGEDYTPDIAEEVESTTPTHIPTEQEKESKVLSELWYSPDIKNSTSDNETNTDGKSILSQARSLERKDPFESFSQESSGDLYEEQVDEKFAEKQSSTSRNNDFGESSGDNNEQSLAPAVSSLKDEKLERELAKLERQLQREKRLREREQKKREKEEKRREREMRKRQQKDSDKESEEDSTTQGLDSNLGNESPLSYEPTVDGHEDPIDRA